MTLSKFKIAEYIFRGFLYSFENIKGDTKLASPDIFANRTLSEEINFNMSDV